jgi:predicted nucleotidyltransferase
MVTRVVDDESIRSFLLSEVLRFVERARSCPGVRRIALVGSLVRDKHDPKDADVLVTVDDDADLASLATAGRGLKGRAQSRNKGADVFLADPSGTYIGRIAIGVSVDPESGWPATLVTVGAGPFCTTTWTS